jgi:hypothetical protein
MHILFLSHVTSLQLEYVIRLARFLYYRYDALAHFYGYLYFTRDQLVTVFINFNQK